VQASSPPRWAPRWSAPQAASAQLKAAASRGEFLFTHKVAAALMSLLSTRWKESTACIEFRKLTEPNLKQGLAAQPNPYSLVRLGSVHRPFTFS